MNTVNKEFGTTFSPSSRALYNVIARHCSPKPLLISDSFKINDNEKE